MIVFFTVIALVLGFTTSVFAAKKSSDRYAAMVVDGHTGKVLFSRNSDDFRFPASLTKIMTLYLLFDEIKSGRINYNTRLIVTKNAANQQPSRVGLKEGETIKVINAIKSLVTKSANDVAVVVAENLAGTEVDFARAMTLRAHRLGMTRTRFMNASGLPNSRQVTTARDMITLSRRMMSDFPKLYKFFKTRYFTYRGKKYRNHNRLLFNYKGTEGIKTGYTRASGFNLTASVRRGKKHLVAVVMGGQSARKRDAHMRSILNRSIKKAIAYVPPKKPRKIEIAAAKPRAPLDARNIVTKKTALENKLQLQIQGSRPPVQNIKQTYQPASQSGALRPAITSDQTQKVDPLSGPFHVQVGAFSTLDEAHARLILVSTKASDILNGHPPVTLPFPDASRNLIRARFAAFSEDNARSTCKMLKKRSIDCIVMQAH